MTIEEKEKIFNDVYDRKHRAVFYHCIGFCNSFHIAEELSQEVFLNLYNKIDSFRGESHIDTWLFKITKNMCSNYIRNKKTNKRNAVVLSTEDILWRAEGADSKPSKFYFLLKYFEDKKIQNPLDQLISKQKRELVMVEINKMKESNKKCLLAFIEHGDFDSYKEVAKCLGIKEDAVRSRLGRARAILNKRIAKHFD